MKSGVDYWKDGLEIVKKDAVSWMIATFVAYLLCMIPGVGIVSLFHMAEKGKKGEKVSINDALFGLQKLVPSLIAGIIFMIPMCICGLPILYFGPQMIWAFAMIARGEETDGIAAIKKSMALVKEKGGFGAVFMPWLLCGILSGIGSVACYVGALFTIPCGVIGYDNMYDDLKGGG